MNNELLHKFDGLAFLTLSSTQQIESHSKHTRMSDIIRVGFLELLSVLSEQNHERDAVENLSIGVGHLRVVVVVVHHVFEEFFLKDWRPCKAAFGRALSEPLCTQVALVAVRFSAAIFQQRCAVTSICLIDHIHDVNYRLRCLGR